MPRIILRTRCFIGMIGFFVPKSHACGPYLREKCQKLASLALRSIYPTTVCAKLTLSTKCQNWEGCRTESDVSDEHLNFLPKVLYLPYSISEWMFLSRNHDQ